MPRKVTFQQSPLVYIRIAGESSPDAPHYADDGGLINDFLSFIHAKGIPIANVPGHADAGRLSYGFHPDDAATALAWLRARGAVETEQKITRPFKLEA